MISPPLPLFSFFFFFNDTATTEIYTLSLHDALPIWLGIRVYAIDADSGAPALKSRYCAGKFIWNVDAAPAERSEEHTSELQSQSNLVCRLLLEKKKKKRSASITVTGR